MTPERLHEALRAQGLAPDVPFDRTTREHRRACELVLEEIFLKRQPMGWANMPPVKKVHLPTPMRGGCHGDD